MNETEEALKRGKKRLLVAGIVLAVLSLVGTSVMIMHPWVVCEDGAISGGDCPATDAEAPWQALFILALFAGLAMITISLSESRRRPA